MWGGATFDVCYRFLSEDPWERLRQIRAAVPNVCLQVRALVIWNCQRQCWPNFLSRETR